MVYIVGVVLACVLRATTKKGQLFFRKKCTPEKILATPMLGGGNKDFAMTSQDFFTEV